MVSIRHLQEVLTLQKLLLVLFRTLHQTAAFVTVQKFLETELCGQAGSCSKHYSVQFRNNSGLTGGEVTCALPDSSSAPFSAT